MTTTDLVATWVALANESRADGDIRVRRLGLRTPDGPVLAGRDAAGCDHLLIAASGEFSEDRQSAGVHVLRRTLAIDGEAHDYVDVACQLPTGNPVFHRLADEIYEDLRSTPNTPLFVVHNVLGRWRDLLAELFPPLGPSALAGLFAELWWLRRVVELDDNRRVELWRGPLGELHDLRCGNLALEIKATTRREGQFIEIHGAEQLVPPPGGRLFLAYTRLREDESGRSVSDEVAELISLGVHTSDLVDRLERTGWTSAESDLYDSSRFVVSDHDLYLVDDQFPRIVPSSFQSGNVPAGVLALRYAVDLTGPFPRPESTASVERVLTELAGAA